MVTVSVCIGSACHLKGSYLVISGLQELIESHRLENQVEIKAVFCQSHCSGPVSVRVNSDGVQSVQSGNVKEFFLQSVLPLCAAEVPEES